MDAKTPQKKSQDHEMAKPNDPIREVYARLVDWHKKFDAVREITTIRGLIEVTEGFLKFVPDLRETPLGGDDGLGVQKIVTSSFRYLPVEHINNLIFSQICEMLQSSSDILPLPVSQQARFDWYHLSRWGRVVERLAEYCDMKNVFIVTPLHNAIMESFQRCFEEKVDDLFQQVCKIKDAHEALIQRMRRYLPLYYDTALNFFHSAILHGNYTPLIHLIQTEIIQLWVPYVSDETIVCETSRLKTMIYVCDITVGTMLFQEIVISIFDLIASAPFDSIFPGARMVPRKASFIRFLHGVVVASFRDSFTSEFLDQIVKANRYACRPPAQHENYFEKFSIKGVNLFLRKDGTSYLYSL